MDPRKNQTSPNSRAKMKNTIAPEDFILKRCVVDSIIRSFDEKRDAYNEVVSSVIGVVDSQDPDLIRCLKDHLCHSVTANPMTFGGRMFATKALTRLVAERPNFVIDLFEQVIESAESWSGNFLDEIQSLRVKIISIKAIRQAEQVVGARQTKIPDEEIEKLSIDAIYKCDDKTKIDTLSLILASRKTAKPLVEKEFHLFKVIFRDALSLQEPALRQIFLSQTNKLLIRIVDSIRVVMRETSTRTAHERTEIKARYDRFLRWLVTYCFDSIYCNAYFGSFILTMSTLKLVIQNVKFTNPNLAIKSLFDGRRCYEALLSCLTDSFEENKSMALDLLLLLPRNDEFINEARMNCFENIAYELVTSVNPAHSLTCLYVFRLSIGLQQRQEGCKKSKNQLLLHHLNKLTDIVEENVHETRDNFILALKRKSIYPKLTCIRALLGDIEIANLESDRCQWEILTKRIVQVSIDACQAVSAIVCNLNPETIGHLPMDLKSVDIETLAKNLKISLRISDAQKSKISSQMLLISGWKTIKECSLSLGALCTRLWWPKEPIRDRNEKFPGSKTKPILNSDEIITIIEFFDHYLRNLRHRGAFEQAYNGFIMVTRRIWHDECFRNLLVENLFKILNDFRNEAIESKRMECLKAYVTRRSAGLPFIVQAILSSEHKHDSKILRSVMNCLFEVLESEASEEYQRIHCLNILRALVKEHSLGEKMLPFVGKTFEIAMDSFKSEVFSIRNCANMLLKAAVDRTFGINRLRADIHRKNQLSFEKFFTECPGLHSKMLHLLEDGLIDKRYLAAVHSVFIVLFRLRPSLEPSEAYNNEKVIRPYVNLVTQLALTCPDSKLRELAAELAVRLETFCDEAEESYNKTIDSLRQMIFGPLSIGNNKLHGALLLTRAWINYNHSSTARRDDFREFAQQAAFEIVLNPEKRCRPNLVKSTALDIIEICCFHQSAPPDWLDSYYVWAIELYQEAGKPQGPFYGTLLFKAFCLLLMKHFHEIASTGIQEREGEAKVFLGGFLKNFLAETILKSPGETVSLDFQAGIIRFLRQLLVSGPNEFIDNVLLDKLDIDFTAAYMTAFDRIKLMRQSNSKGQGWSDCFSQPTLRHGLIHNLDLNSLLNLSHYDEFKPKMIEEKMAFTTRWSNTARSVELLLFAYKTWDDLDLINVITWHKNHEATKDKLHFITQFISSLPDCDVRCLAVLCAGKLSSHELREINHESCTRERYKSLEDFSELLDNLSDGDHSLTMRIACSEVLRENLALCIEKRRFKFLQKYQVNLISSLIKLSQDEEYDVRLSSQKVILRLSEIEDLEVDKLQVYGGARLNQLINLIATHLFDPNSNNEANNCFELMMRIIFNHSRNYSNNPDEERERLFDKTKLNTFADHVATIKAALEGLQKFFGNRRQKIDLNALRLSSHLIEGLKTHDPSCEHSNACSATGDYSWHIKREQAHAIGGLDENIPSYFDNNQIVDILLRQILNSLDYFSDGYVKVLTDTDYTFRELSLYKKVAFLRFVMSCTVFNLKNGHLIDEIRDKLGRIIEESCSTTILYKIVQSLVPN